MRHPAAKLPKFSVLSINVGNAHLLITILFLAFCFTPKVNFAQSKSDKRVLKTIVIDAGHGGKDPGCHGSFAHEKHVCLAIALRLGELIKAKYPNINLVYTRNTDVFVELIERANIANRAKADLFICIHANAGSNVAYGTETYVLGLHRTEAQQRVAERENSIIALEDDKGAKYEDFDMSPDAIIAKQLQLSVFLDHSILFATNLQKEFKRIGRYDRGVKQAGFLVLYKTTMPSVLIETGFLTNPSEENFLGKNEGQEKMANSMFKAFESYKNQLEGKAVISENPSPNLVSNENPKKEEKPAITKDSTGLIFRIQIETSDKKLATNSTRFKGLEIFEYHENKLYKYCTGLFHHDLKAAKEYKIELIEKGFNNAFVVAFLNEERISIEKAIKLAEK
ncbi:MAG: N-acetylmuramoyl-L-alanine amidase [Bacteroidetes bacterium]|nr:N-acetylmuramoyl-L-alanine amidase [Bacteroidota bacterium]